MTGLYTPEPQSTSTWLSVGWSAVNDYLSTHSSALEVLRASKAVSPLQYDAAESVLEILRNEESVRADRLLTPLRNWLVFEAEVVRMLRMSDSGADSIITLGGEDERFSSWDVWHRGCPGPAVPSNPAHLLAADAHAQPPGVGQGPALTTGTNRDALRGQPHEAHPG